MLPELDGVVTNSYAGHIRIVFAYTSWSSGLNLAPKMSTIAPKMSTIDTRVFSEVLFRQTRSAVLSVLYRSEGTSLYLRELVGITGAGMGAVEREVRQLLDVGLITKSRRGNQTLYRANPASPAFNEIKSLVTKRIRPAKSNRGVKGDSGLDESAPKLLPEQELILDAIGETMGKRRLGAKATRSELISSAIRNFIADCREEEDLREAIDEARIRMITHE